MSSLKVYIEHQFESMTPRVELICAYAVAFRQHQNASTYKALVKARKQLVALEATVLNAADMEEIFREATNHLSYWEMMQRHLA
jgi:hypothetical protein